VLRQRSFFTGRPVHTDGSTDLAWFAADGEPMGHRWDGPAEHVLQALYNGLWHDQQSVLVVVNGAATAADVTLPAAPGTAAYELVWDSSDARPSEPGAPVAAGTTLTMGPASMRVWCAVDAD